jgi:uncharacterized protein YbaR (Trm112 family)
VVLEDALVRILACPIDKGMLLYFADGGVLYNPRLRRLYRIEDGIPMMLAQRAAPVPDEEHKRLLDRALRGEAARTGQTAETGQPAETGQTGETGQTAETGQAAPVPGGEVPTR